MHSVQCNVQVNRCTLYNVLYRWTGVHCTLYCTGEQVYTVHHCTVQVNRCTLYTVLYRWTGVHCTLYCTGEQVYTVHCTLYCTGGWHLLDRGSGRTEQWTLYYSVQYSGHYITCIIQWTSYYRVQYMLYTLHFTFTVCGVQTKLYTVVCIKYTVWGYSIHCNVHRRNCTV